MFVSTEIVGENVRLSLMNTSKDPINMTPDRLMERFVRGDLSRHTEGNGLGLAIVKSLVELQNARIWLDVDGDLFKVFMEFPILTEEKPTPQRRSRQKNYKYISTVLRISGSSCFFRLSTPGIS